MCDCAGGHCSDRLEDSWSSAGGAPPLTPPLHVPEWGDPVPQDAAGDCRTLLLMEYADQKSLHAAISRGRLQGNLVSQHALNAFKLKIETHESCGRQFCKAELWVLTQTHH